MRTLAFDMHRCQPSRACDKCQQCLRYADMPGQTWGDRTPIAFREGSSSEHCAFIPIEDKKK